MNIGTKDVIGAYVGSQKIYKIYAGNNLVYTGILDTPQNLSINAGEVSFNAVSGASNYDILSNGVLVNTVNSNQFDIDTLSSYPSITAGQHSLTVKANSSVYRQSEASSPLSYNKLSSISNEEILDDSYSFNGVSNAYSYSIYANDGLGSTILLGMLIVLAKGAIIQMNVDGTDKQFRVLNVNGTNAEVVMMSNASDSQQFASSGNIYAGSALDTYLNTTWYNTLNATAKAAIVDKTFRQDSWYGSAAGNPDYRGYYGATKPGTIVYTISLGNASYGAEITRHVYALSVQDVLDYILDTSITDGQFRNYNIWKMFWNDEVQHAVYLWLRSADASLSSRAFSVTGSGGHVNFRDIYYNYAVRPAFTIDLTKIPFTIVS